MGRFGRSSIKALCLATLALLCVLGSVHCQAVTNNLNSKNISSTPVPEPSASSTNAPVLEEVVKVGPISSLRKSTSDSDDLDTSKAATTGSTPSIPGPASLPDSCKATDRVPAAAPAGGAPVPKNGVGIAEEFAVNSSDSVAAHNGEQKGPVKTAEDVVPAATREDAGQVGADTGSKVLDGTVQIRSLTNFALGKDGAKVLATNAEARKPGALLDDDSDTFLKNDCKADKWVILELSAVATISVVELVQNELYSSRVKDFEVYARQSNPRQDAGGDLAAGLANPLWRMVGNFTAPKTKGLQRFELQHPGWARYVLVRFLTHYSSEPVCAMNGIAVYGKSAAEELEDELAQVSARDEAREALAPEALEGVGLLRGTDVASKTGEGLEPLIAAALDAGNASGSGPLDPVAASESSETSTRAQNTVAGSALRTPALLPDERQGKVAADTRGDATSSTAGTASPSMGGSASAGLESPKPDAVAPELVDSHSVTPVIAPRSPGRLGINASLGLSQGNASAVAPPKGARDAGLSTKPGDAMTSRPSGLPAPSAAKEAVAHVDALSLSQPASKRKGGASVYDILVQELKATKLQTKSLARIVSDMQANHTGSMVALQAGLETVKREQELLSNNPAPHLKAWQASLLRELDDLRAQVFMLWIAVGSLSLCVCAPTILRAVQKLPLRTTIAALIIGVGAFESYRVLML
ncbi:hypothetical protein ACKKBF_B35075 [Auxenochlorella protothecoides x Auxenochlorella symbiontica]